MLNVAVAEVSLQGAGVVALVGQGITASVPKHVWVAAFIKRSTSTSVRYSRVRRSALGGRLGGDCAIYGGWCD
jgi:hypothetical protein